MSRYDVIVVGGGMAGLSAAESLLATSGGRGGKLLLLEAAQRLAINSGDTLFHCLGLPHLQEQPERQPWYKQPVVHCASQL